MSAAQFRPHGIYSVHVDDRLLVVETSGPWNKELIEMFGLDTAERVRQLAGQPWAVLATVTKDGMHTPDSYAAMIAGIRYQRGLGRCATAVILREIEAPALVESILHRMYTEAEEPHAFFDDEIEARAWLARYLPLS